MTIPASIAVEKLATSSLEYRLLSNITIKPLITIINNPRLNKIAGNDSNITIGLIIELIIASRNPAETSTNKLLSYVIPVNKPAATQSPSELVNHLIKNLDEARLLIDEYCTVSEVSRQGSRKHFRAVIGY